MEDLGLNEFGTPGEEEGGTEETNIDDTTPQPDGMDYGDPYGFGFGKIKENVIEMRALNKEMREKLKDLKRARLRLEFYNEMKEKGEGGSMTHSLPGNIIDYGKGYEESSFNRTKGYVDKTISDLRAMRERLEELRREREEEEREKDEEEKREEEDLRALRYRVGQEGYMDGLTTTQLLRRVYGERLPDYQNPLFLEHMIKERNLVATKEGDIYKLQFLGEPEREGGRDVFPHRIYEAGLDGEMENFEGFNRDFAIAYDNWRREILKNRVKKAGVIGGIVLSIAGIITGLSLGLRRKGSEMVHDGEVKWSKLTPAEREREVIPWTEIEKAGGKTVIVIGEYLYVIIGGTIVYYVTRK